MTSGIARSTWLAALLAAGSFASGCNGDCQCADRRGVVTVPASRAADVSIIDTSGPACPGTPVVCTNADTPCTQYIVRGYDVGACHVTFQFTSGAAPVSFDFEFESVDSSCCGGGYFPLVGTAQRTVPEATDGGARDQ